MSDVTAVLSLEDLRCSSCKNFLSCAPIQALSNGNSICGNCSLLYVDKPTYRVLTLEAILNKVSFPCKFKQYGCEENLLFGHINEHEAECDLRSHNCAILSNDSLWKRAFQIFEPDSHPKAIAKAAEFKLDITHDKEETLVLDYEDIKFVMKYVYCSETSNLWYGIKYVSLNVEEASCKIVFKNDIEEGYTLILKGNDCLPYCGNVWDMENGNSLLLNNILPVLNNPNRISIIIEVFVKKIDTDDEEEEEDEKSLIVDYDLLEKLRCKECKTYVVPPVYIPDEGGSGFLCRNCNTKTKNCKLLEDDTPIQRLINQANYPCRWRGCENIEKANNITEHERTCTHRMYTCYATTCQVIFGMNDAVLHLQTHGYVQFTNKFVYTISLGKYSKAVHGFSQKWNEIIFIKYHNKCSDAEEMQYLHKIRLVVLSSNKSAINAKVQFGHTHCKIKSPEFIVTNHLYSGLKNMPSCFKIHDQLTVTVKLQRH